MNQTQDRSTNNGGQTVETGPRNSLVASPTRTSPSKMLVAKKGEGTMSDDDDSDEE